MRVAHVAIWTTDIERLASFWSEMFGARVGERYHSKNRAGFVSRFLDLGDGPTIEIMTGPWVEVEGARERSGTSPSLSEVRRPSMPWLKERAVSTSWFPARG